MFRVKVYLVYENGRASFKTFRDQNNIVDVSRVMITFKSGRGYAVRKWEIEKVEKMGNDGNLTIIDKCDIIEYGKVHYFL